MTLIRTVVAGLILLRISAADQILLKNGDKITGAVVKKDGDKLTVKSDIFGEVTMPWSSITSVTSDAPLTVVMPGDKELNGKVSTQGSDLAVQNPTQSAATPATAPLGQVTAIRNAAEQARYERLLHPTWLDLWAGYADLGLALARGNAQTTTLTSSFNATRATMNDKTSVFFNQIYATALINQIDAATANAARGGISYDHNINSRLFYNVQTTEEYDNFQSLNFRGVVGAGLGFHAIKTDRTTLDILGGGDFAHEAYTTSSRNLGELNGGDDFSHKLSGITSVTQEFRIYYAPAQTQAPFGNQQYRMNFDLGAATKIFKVLSWQVSLNDRFLNTPLLGRKRNDVLLTTGLRITFAQ